MALFYYELSRNTQDKTAMRVEKMHDIHHSFSVCSLRRLFFDYLQVDYAASIWVGGEQTILSTLLLK